MTPRLLAPCLALVLIVLALPIEHGVLRSVDRHDVYIPPPEVQPLVVDPTVHEDQIVLDGRVERVLNGRMVLRHSEAVTAGFFDGKQ